MLADRINSCVHHVWAAPLLVFFLLRETLAAAECYAGDESCSVDLGLLQKSVQAQVPVAVTSVNSLSAFDWERKQKDDDEEMEIKRLRKVNSSSLSALYDERSECEQGEYNRGDGCERCNGRSRRRRADTCESCAEGYEPEAESDSCRIKPASTGSLIDYAYVHPGRCSGTVLQDGQLSAQKQIGCAKRCRENAACAYFSHNRVSQTCELYGLRECDEEETPTADFETHTMTLFYYWYHPGTCVMNASNGDMVTIDTQADTVAKCGQASFRSNMNFFSFNRKRRVCRRYHMRRSICKEATSLEGFQTYAMLVKNERQGNDVAIKLRNNDTGIITSRVLALTFQGNGNLAMSCYAGLMGGLLGGAAKVTGDKEFNLTKLLRHFDMVVSNSGGSWYVGSLMYSDFFRQTQEAMGREPEVAGKVWNTEIMNAQSNLRFLTDLMTGSFYNTIRGLKEGITRTDWDIELGNASAHQAWAKHKLWLVIATLTSANSAETVRVNQTVRYYLNSTDPSIHLPAAGYLPSFFSVRLNEYASSYLSPLPFCGESGGESCWHVNMVHGNTCSEMNSIKPNAVFMLTGRMLLTSVLAASSACMASETMGASAFSLYGQFTTQMSIWAMPFSIRPLASGDVALMGDSFGDDALCEIFALSDGAFTDNTGITHAVANGADEVTSFLNAAGVYEELYAIGSPHEECPYSLFSENLPIMMLMSRFLRDVYSVEMQFSRIRFAVLNVTTRKNEWFGTSGGRDIRLNIMIMYNSYSYKWLTLSMTVVSPWWGNLVQLLVNILNSPVNREHVCTTLTRFFHIDTVCNERPGIDANSTAQIEYYKNLFTVYAMNPSEYFWSSLWYAFDPIIDVTLRSMDYLYLWFSGQSSRATASAKAGCES